jgi:hypothetical protein
MGLFEPTPGGNTGISRRDVFALAASAAIGGDACAALAAGAMGQPIWRAIRAQDQIAATEAGRCNAT